VLSAFTRIPSIFRVFQCGIDVDVARADAPRVVEVAVRTTVGAIAGALLATLGLAVVQSRTTTHSLVPGAASATLMGLAPTMMRCAPGQQAVLQQSVVDGRIVTSADCAWDTSLAGTYAPGLRPLPVNDIVEYQPRARTVSYVQDEPVRRRVVRTAPKRSWQKSALVIGGSAGAGAGIGALAGGKKGALIGAAIGGGAGSIFEAFKRK
jgi:hypothetical protein